MLITLMACYCADDRSEMTQHNTSFYPMPGSLNLHQGCSLAGSVMSAKPAAFPMLSEGLDSRSRVGLHYHIEQCKNLATPGGSISVIARTCSRRWKAPVTYS